MHRILTRELAASWREEFCPKWAMHERATLAVQLKNTSRQAPEGTLTETNGEGSVVLWKGEETTGSKMQRARFLKIMSSLFLLAVTCCDMVDLAPGMVSPIFPGQAP